MATIITEFEHPVFYSKGTSGASAIVGYADGVNRVVRYKFTTPAIGASKFTFSKPSITVYSNSIGSSEKLRFYVTDDPASYANAGANAEYHGTVSVSGNTATGSADITLLPNKEYYLFIFPGFASYGAYNWNYPPTITVTLDGGAGLVYIKKGSEVKKHQAYVKKGSTWQHLIPYKKEGSSWDLLT